MFKRKSNFPPRPKLPSANHIAEDLCAATEDGHFLEVAKCINMEGIKSDESHIQDLGYQKVKNFLEQNEELNKAMQELKEVYENLEACNTEISILTEDLKEQAIKALL